VISSRTARDPKIDKAEQESAIVCLLGKSGREVEEPAEGLIAQNLFTTNMGRLVHRELPGETSHSKCGVSAKPKHHLKCSPLGCHLHRHPAPPANFFECFLRV